MNEQELILTRKLEQAREIIARWRYSCVLPELHAKLCKDSDEILKGGDCCVYAEKGCKEIC